MNNDSGKLSDDAAAQHERSTQIPSDIDSDQWAQDPASYASIAHALFDTFSDENEVNVPGCLPASGQAGTQLNDSSSPPVTINNLHLYGDFHMNTSGLRSSLPSTRGVRNLLSAHNELGVQRSSTAYQPEQQSVPGFNSTDTTSSQQLAQWNMLQHGVRQPQTALPLYYFPQTSGAHQNGLYGNGQIQQQQMRPLEGVTHETLDEVDASVARLNQLMQNGECSVPEIKMVNEKEYRKLIRQRSLLRASPEPLNLVTPSNPDPNDITYPQNIINQPVFMSEKQRGKQPERNQAPLVSLHQSPPGYRPYSAIQRGPPPSILDQMIHSPGELVPRGYNCHIPIQRIPYLSPPWVISGANNENGKEQQRSGGGPSRTNKKKKIPKQKKEPQGLTEEEKARVKIMAEILRNNPGWDAGADDFDVQQHSYKENGTPNRPSNAWMLYTKKRRQLMKAFFPEGERTGVMSAVLSNLYHSRSNDMKAFHDGRAKDHRDNLLEQHPEYKYTKKSKKDKKKVENDYVEDMEEDDMVDNPDEDEDNGNA